MTKQDKRQVSHSLDLCSINIITTQIIYFIQRIRAKSKSSYNQIKTAMTVLVLIVDSKKSYYLLRFTIV